MLAFSYVHAEEAPTATEEAVVEDTKAVDATRERRSQLDTRTQERIINLSANIIKRLEAGIERMENIIQRIETRMGKLESEGVDVTEARVHLTLAKNAISAAHDTLDELGTPKDAIVSDTPRASFTTIRTQFLAIHGLLKQTRTLLLETVMMLKASKTVGVTNADATSSTTATTTEDTSSQE